MLKQLLVMAVCFLPPLPALAGIAAISSPNIVQGEKTVELGNGWEEGGENVYRHALEFGYSPAAFWKSEVESIAQGGDRRPLLYATTIFKNTLRFLRQDENTLLAAAFRFDYTFDHRGDNADAVDMRMLLQRSHGAFTAVLNLGVEKEIGANAAEGFQSDIRASLRYQLVDWLRPTLEYFGATGPLHDALPYYRQLHQLGPAALVALEKGVEMEIGYLQGVTSGSPDHAAKLNLEWSF